MFTSSRCGVYNKFLICMDLLPVSRLHRRLHRRLQCVSVALAGPVSHPLFAWISHISLQKTNGLNGQKWQNEPDWQNWRNHKNSLYPAGAERSQLIQLVCVYGIIDSEMFFVSLLPRISWTKVNNIYIHALQYVKLYFCKAKNRLDVGGHTGQFYIINKILSRDIRGRLQTIFQLLYRYIRQINCKQGHQDYHYYPASSSFRKSTIFIVRQNFVNKNYIKFHFSVT